MNFRDFLRVLLIGVMGLGRFVIQHAIHRHIRRGVRR